MRTTLLSTQKRERVQCAEYRIYFRGLFLTFLFNQFRFLKIQLKKMLLSIYRNMCLAQ